MDMSERFDAVDDEFLNFDRIENKRSKRPDLHAFLLLDELFPCEGKSDMVCCAEHDEIWLDIPEDAKLTDEQIVELVRCGVRYDDCGFCMFV